MRDHHSPEVDSLCEPGANRFSRSRQMVNALRKQFLYSEKRARDILFREIEAILQEVGSPVTVSQLTREASSRGRRRGQETGYVLPKWDTAGKATINAMLRAGALLGPGGQAIAFGIAAPATRVVGLAGRFEDLTEAYLLETVIRELGDVTTRDHTALAHALFRQFDRGVPLEDLEDRVVALAASLSQRVALTEGGIYCPITDLVSPALT
jgi:hypothetical protein